MESSHISPIIFEIQTNVVSPKIATQESPFK